MKNKILATAGGIAVIAASVGVGASIDKGARPVGDDAPSAIEISLNLYQGQSSFPFNICVEETPICYPFTEKQEIVRFANEVDPADDAFTRNVRGAMKSEIDAEGIDDFISSLRTQ